MPHYQEIMPGVFTRPVGDNEKFHIMICQASLPFGREHWSIPSFVKIQPCGTLASENLEYELREAWKFLRFRHPSIASSLVDNKELRYNVPTTNRILEDWMESSFFVVSGQDRDDVIASHPPEPYFTVRYLPDSSELVFHTSHWRSDGTGVLYLIDDFLDLLLANEKSDAIPWGEEVPRLTVENEEAYGIPRSLTKEIKETAAKWSHTFALIPGTVGIRYTPKKDIPGGVRMVDTHFSPAQTEAVVQACNRLNVSVTSAVHASLALTNWKYAAEENKQKHYTSTLIFSMRPYLPPPYNTRDYAAAEAVTGYMFAVEPTQSWLELAQTYNKAYKAGLPNGFLDAHRQYGADIMDLLAKTDSSAPPPSNGDISSLGKLNDKIKSSRGTSARGVDVIDLGIGVELSTPQLALYVFTFRDQLTLCNCYNENFHKKSDVVAFTESVKETLLNSIHYQLSNCHRPIQVARNWHK